LSRQTLLSCRRGGDAAIVDSSVNENLAQGFGLTVRRGKLTVNDMAQPDSGTNDTSGVRLLSREEAEQEDRVFWHSKTPAERLAAAERLRQVAYGYDPITARIQAVVVCTRLKPG
jgi:hypothetical protein